MIFSLCTALFKMLTARDPPEERQPDIDSEKRIEHPQDVSPMDRQESYHKVHGVMPRGGRPPMSPYTSHVSHPKPYRQYPEHHHGTPHSTHNIQSVVTSSFSSEERDTTATRSGETSESGERREDSHSQSREHEWQARLPKQQTELMPSPSHQMAQPRVVPRAYSTGAYYSSHSHAMKRNYYHHIQSEEYKPDLPTDFLPPKRAKITNSARPDTVVTPRMQEEEGALRDWCGQQGGSWQQDEGSRYKYLNGRSHSYPVPPTWQGPYYHPSAPVVFGQPGYPIVSPHGPREEGLWHSNKWSGPSPSSAWTSPKRSSSSWSSPRKLDDGRNAPPFPQISPDGKMDLMAKAVSYASTKEDTSMTSEGDMRFGVDGDSRTLTLPTGETLLLLALPQDRVSLSETLCVVREVCVMCVIIILVSLSSLDSPVCCLSFPIHRTLRSSRQLNVTSMLRLRDANMQLLLAR